jgi:coproporphyrinogen III oxidase
MNAGSRRAEVQAYLTQLQDTICRGLEAVDGLGTFHEDSWSHANGGGGRTRVMSNGAVFSKGGVNFSAVEGPLPPFVSSRVSPNARKFYATGVSLVMHPQSPHVPIVHMNVRYFETDAGDSWFGGGIDLTPIYVNTLQAATFHQHLSSACRHLSAEAYSTFKEWADNYFYNKHRGETRGVGGIFYDDLSPGQSFSFEHLFGFTRAVGNTFLQAYIPLVEANKGRDFTEKEKTWQLIRRGRYVEFNLVYDRGTKFGLETGGRIESILMSLPDMASWIYNFVPQEGSAEALTQSYLRQGIDWLGMHKQVDSGMS